MSIYVSQPELILVVVRDGVFEFRHVPQRMQSLLTMVVNLQLIEICISQHLTFLRRNVFLNKKGFHLSNYCYSLEELVRIGINVGLHTASKVLVMR